MKKLKSYITTNRLIIFFSILGIILSSYLWVIQVQDPANVIVPCATGGGCYDVLTSKFGKIFGVPMSVFGFFYYSFLVYTSLLREKIKSVWLNRTLQGAVIWGVIFSMYLRYLEFSVIGHVCSWCWLSVLIVLILVGIIWYEQKKLKIKD